MQPLNTAPPTKAAIESSLLQKFNLSLLFLIGIFYSINSIAQDATIPTSIVTCSESGITTIPFTATKSIQTNGSMFIRFRYGVSGSVQSFAAYTNTGPARTPDLKIEVNNTNGTVRLIDNRTNVDFTNQNLNFVLPEGPFFMDGTYTDGSGSDDGAFFSNNANYSRGQAPLFTINNKSEEAVRLLQGCESNILLKMNTSCATDKMLLSIREVNPFVLLSNGAFSPIGSEAARHLTAGELTSLKGSGLNINTFEGLTIQTGKTYSILLAYNGQGVWKPTYKYLQYKAGKYDLVMKDHINDNGFEPSVRGWSTTDPFKSPDLWNRLSVSTAPVNSSANEDPDHVTIPGNTNKMMVAVKNVGCDVSPANVPIKMYWTLARTNEFWDAHWKYDEINNSITLTSGAKAPLGSEATIEDATFAENYGKNPQISQPYFLKSLNANEVFAIPFSNGVDWFPPKPSDYTPLNSSIQFTNIGAFPVICFLARIEDTNDPISFQPSGNYTQIKPYVINNNNVVTRNSRLVDGAAFKIIRGDGTWDNGTSTVIIVDPVDPGFGQIPLEPQPQLRDICLELLPNEELENPFVTLQDFAGSIELLMTDRLWEAWDAAGFVQSNITIPDGQGPRVVMLENASIGCIRDLMIPAAIENEFEQLGVRFVFSGESLPEQPVNLTYRLSVNPAASTLNQLGDLAPSYNSSNAIFEIVVPNEAPQLNLTSVKQVTPVQSVKVYPNPVNNQLTIQQLDKTHTIEKLEIFDIRGQLIYINSNLLKGNNIIDTQDWSNGIYVVKIFSQEGVQVVKVQINH
jgi:hypothetical protein